MATLKETATFEFDQLAEKGVDSRQATYLSGWYQGEWTCPHCGRMYGKNLLGESPFFLARQHSTNCHIPTKVA